MHSSGGGYAEGTLGSLAGDCRKGNRRGTEAWSVWWRRAVGTLVDGCGGQCKEQSQLLDEAERRMDTVV